MDINSKVVEVTDATVKMDTGEYHVNTLNERIKLCLNFCRGMTNEELKGDVKMRLFGAYF